MSRHETRSAGTAPWREQAARRQPNLHEGSAKLSEGTGRLHKESKALPTGLEELQDGTFRLANGINRLQGGSETLQSNLSEGFHRAYPLQKGLHNASVKVTRGAGATTKKVENLNKKSPGLFNSGYYVLSALDGAPPAERERANEAISLERTAARARRSR